MESWSLECFIAGNLEADVLEKLNSWKLECRKAENFESWELWRLEGLKLETWKADNLGKLEAGKLAFKSGKHWASLMIEYMYYWNVACKTQKTICKLEEHDKAEHQQGWKLASQKTRVLSSGWV